MLSSIRTVKVNAVRVERQRRISKERHRIGAYTPHKLFVSARSLPNSHRLQTPFPGRELWQIFTFLPSEACPSSVPNLYICPWQAPELPPQRLIPSMITDASVNPRHLLPAATCSTLSPWPPCAYRCGPTQRIPSPVGNAEFRRVQVDRRPDLRSRSAVASGAKHFLSPRLLPSQQKSSRR